MILIIYISLFIFNFFINKFIFGKYLTGLFIYNIIWSLVGIFASFNFYDMYPISIEIKVIILFSVFCFNVFYILLSNKKYLKNKSTLNLNLDLKIVFIFNIISYLYLISFIIRAFEIIKTSGFRVLRIYAFDPFLWGVSTYKLLIIQWIIYPIFIVTIIYSIIYILKQKKLSLLFFIGLFDMILYTFIFAGRYLILMYVLFTIFAFILLVGKKIYLSKFNLKLFLMLIILFISIIVITQFRNWNYNSFLKDLYIYFIGSSKFLDILYTNNTFPEIYLYGKGTFGFILNNIEALKSMIFGLDYNGTDNIISNILGSQVHISDSQTYNALPTYIYTFIADFGLFGVFIGNFIFVLFITFVEKMYYRNYNLVYFALYIWVLFLIFDTIFTYRLLLPFSGITIFFIIFFNLKIQNKKVSI